MTVINTRASMTSQLQNPTMSRRGVPVSFVNLDDEPVDNPDAAPPVADMPDTVPAHIDPTPDEPNEDEDEREGESVEGKAAKASARMQRISVAMAKIREGYIELSNIYSGQ